MPVLHAVAFYSLFAAILLDLLFFFALILICRGRKKH